MNISENVLPLACFTVACGLSFRLSPQKLLYRAQWRENRHYSLKESFLGQNFQLQGALFP